MAQREIPPLSYQDLACYTDNFSESNYLCHFQFGKLYRGKIGERYVMVKIWEVSEKYYYKPGDYEFRLMDEVCLLGHRKMINHPGMLKLLGYCYEDDLLGIVYDFKPFDTVYNLILEGVYPPYHFGVRWDERSLEKVVSKPVPATPRADLGSIGSGGPPKAYLGSAPEQLDEENFSLAVIVIWKSWDNRNKRRHGESGIKANELVGWCKVFLENFKQAHFRPIPLRNPTLPSLWKPPEDGFIKLNVDAAFPPGEDFYSTSLVARNSRGECL
ncbi:PREDICTED: uncharacterized protein LOC105951703 [Erythranthe guttata]|uniref:uncharacterized protein LOC105951703 n=1 Tax=Erythranthe guttata TaxID=4155 RepID=UPI00064D7948|nr:PREDICTED: uncharacterized protein LOC105951703 [Erythranthe guttata]|eukprot:XP_012830608.1 PREDICTED: uncharacterized protein LOC105951703 [Erythranthe guttata]